MSETGSPVLPGWRRLLARRRTRVLLAIVLLLVVVRIALPAVLRRVVVAQADEALVGRIEIDDVDLAVLTGGVTLHGLRVFSGEAAEVASKPKPPESAAAAGAVDPGTAGLGTATTQPALPSPSPSPTSTATPDAAAPIDDTHSPPHTATPGTTMDGATPPTTVAPSPAPAAGVGPPGAAPVLSAERLSVKVAYRALFHRIVEIQRIELDGVTVSLDRAKDGTLLLPAAVPAAEPTPVPSPEAPGWGVLVRSVALHDGRIGFRDFAIGNPPQRVEVTLPTLDASELALLITQQGLQPGTVALDAGIQDGTLHLDAKLETLAAGPAYESHVVLTNVPIADSRLYIPNVGWSGLTGRLDADLVHRFESQGAHVVHGKAALRDLDVRVAGLDDPALAWRSLAVDVTGIDFVAQHADVAAVTLDGARIVTRPAGPEPLPVLKGLVTAAAEKATLPSAAPPTPVTSPAPGASPAPLVSGGADPSATVTVAAGSSPAAGIPAPVASPATAEPAAPPASAEPPASPDGAATFATPPASAVPTTDTAPAPNAGPLRETASAPVVTPTPGAAPPSTMSPAAPIAAAPPSATVASAGARPWTWSIAKARVTAGHVEAIGGDGPLGIAIDAEAGPLTSTRGSSARIGLTLTPSSGGTLELAGDFTAAPLAFDGTLAVNDLRLATLTAPVATAATRLLRDGVASLDLTIAAGATPNAPADGVRIAGTIGIADLAVAGEDPEVFGLRWKNLAVALKEVTAPGVLHSSTAGTAAPIDAALDAVTLTEADVTLTRTADGIALPAPLGGTRPATAPGPAAATGPLPAGEGADRRPLPRPTTAPSPAAPPGPTAATVAVAESPTSSPPLPVHVQVDRVAIDKMRLTTHDTTVQPFFHSTLDPVDLAASAVGWPGPSAKDVKLVAKTADGGVLTLTGDVAPGRTRLVAKLADLPLAPFNPYATGTGYGVTGGTARLDTTLTVRGDAYDTSNRLVLHELGVTSGEGEALFMNRFGMPLELALSLLTDLSGNIVLEVPVSGDAQGMRTDLGTLVGNALTRAILNAVTSPLKLIGAVAHIGDKPAALAPPPLVFLAGRPTLADGEAAKLAPLAGLVARAPGLRLHLRAEVGDADRRWLREQALRAKLEAESGVLGSVRHIAERGARKAVLAALTARADGKPGEVPAEYQEWFEAAVAEQAIDDGALRALAEARIAALQTQLASSHGVDAGRIVVDDPRLDAAAQPTVAVGLGVPAATAPAGRPPSVSPAPSGRPTDAPTAEPGRVPRAGRKPAAPSPHPSAAPATKRPRGDRGHRQ